MKKFAPIAAVIVWAACVRVDAQELKKIKIGYPAVSYNQVHIWVAKDAGLFHKHGLDAEVVFFRGGQMATQALVAGDPPIVNFDMLDLGIEVQGNGFATTRSFIRSQRDTVLAALKAYVEALYYIPRNRDETRRITAKYMRTTDADVLDATYDWFIKRVSKRPYPTLKGIQFLLDEVAGKMANAKTAKPEQFVDLTLLQQLDKEGYFAEMGKRYP